MTQCLEPNEQNAVSEFLDLLQRDHAACVLQTVLESLGRGLRAVVVADAIGSRRDSNKQLAIGRMRDEGAIIVSTEMILFEWMRTARHPVFKEISSLLK